MGSGGSRSEPERSGGERSEAQPNWIQTNLVTKRREQTGGLIESCTSFMFPPGYATVGVSRQESRKQMGLSILHVLLYLSVLVYYDSVIEDGTTVKLRCNSPTWRLTCNPNEEAVYVSFASVFILGMIFILLIVSSCYSCCIVCKCCGVR